MPRLATRIAGEGSFYTAVTILVLFAAFPSYWFNAKPTLEHLEYLFNETLFLQWLSNTALIGLCVVAITLLVALPAGYGLARMPGRSGENLIIGIFLTYLVPP